jgi:hypothetical protein
MQTFGYPADVWQRAKDEIKEVLIQCARRQKTTTYSELVPRIAAIDLQARDARLDELLDQISIDEVTLGRGMLSVLVVHKTGDLRPGRGFYECATRLGLDVSDEERLWVEQLNRVYEVWGHS